MELSKVRGFLRRHKKQEEVAAEAVGISIGWRVVTHLLAAGVAAAAIAVPSMIDLSNNNGPGAAIAIAAPVKAVEAKGTEGLAYRDPDYPVFRTAASKAHKPFGGYFFLHPNESGKAQADYFLAYAKPKPGDLQPVVDTETGDPCSSGLQTLAALKELKAKGYAPIMYTSESWLVQFARCEPGLKNYRVWEAEYGPTLNRVAGFKVVAWQYTDDSGIKGLRIDGSRLYVAPASLEVAKPKPPLTPAQKAAKAKAAALAKRKAHLRTLTGYYAWYEWRHGVSRWHGLKPSEADVRPHVPRRISKAWWKRAARQWKASHGGG